MALSSAAFDNIDGSASETSTSAWAAEEERAKMERARDITVMDIYDIRMERREFDRYTLASINNLLQPLLGQKYFLN